MKIIVNRLGRRLIHGRRLLQLLKLCLGDIFNGFKGFQQRLRPARPYARDRRQAGGQSRSFPGLPVVADGEPVHLPAGPAGLRVRERADTQGCHAEAHTSDA